MLSPLDPSCSDLPPILPKLACALFTAGSAGLVWQSEAVAQIVDSQIVDSGSAQAGSGAVTVNRDAVTGAVSVNRNAYTLETGPLINTSNIPLPAFVPSQTAVGQTIETVTDGSLAPNSVILGTDSDYIRDNFDRVVNSSDTASSDGFTYVLEDGSIRLTTEIRLERAVGNHQYGEGVEVRVVDENNNVVPDARITDSEGRAIDRVFVRGDGVTIGPDGQVLNSSEALTVTYDERQKVTVRLLNLRDDNAAASESGAYFTQDGRLITEDLQDGGDRDFDDGDYLSFRDGGGTALAMRSSTETEITTETEETPLAPEIRREEIVVELPAETVEVAEDVQSEVRSHGRVSLPSYQMTRLGHATGVRTAGGEQTIYSRYADAGQIRAGSDGLSAVGQFAPLNRNPAAPPTLVTGELSFNPFAGDNEAGVVASASVTQFATRTHRAATDALGNRIISNPIASEADGESRLLEPTGWFSNRTLVGYVPEQVDGSRLDLLQLSALTDEADRLLAVDGVFELPSDRAVVIAPPDPQRVGRGASAYTDNVGGLLIESSDGSFAFEPQWTKAGYAQTPTSLVAGSAVRLIYALVPQQSGQRLQLGRRYRVDSAFEGYRIAEGGFRVIAADREPQNFWQETADVYAVEDTLAAQNARTATFNGQRGEYVEPSGDHAATVDLTIPSEVDARVGNAVYSASAVGQKPYARITRAGGLYVSAALTSGIGNQRDFVNQRSATLVTSTDQIRTQRITNTFATPIMQREQIIREESTTLLTTGEATFDINAQGLLENATFSPLSTTQQASAVRTLGTEVTLQRDEEVLTDSVMTESVRVLNSRTEEIASDAESRTDSYANAAPLQGELAVGSVLNFGNTPWTAAANTLRAEVFFRDTILGRGALGRASLGRGSLGEAGWRAMLTFHPFGEVQRAAHQYDEAGNAVPLYQTEPVVDASGWPRMEKIAIADGSAVEVAVNRFVRDEAGDRVPATVGTGRSRGPGLYVRIQDVWSDRASLAIDGGVQFSF